MSNEQQKNLYIWLAAQIVANDYFQVVKDDIIKLNSEKTGNRSDRRKKSKEVSSNFKQYQTITNKLVAEYDDFEVQNLVEHIHSLLEDQEISIL